MPHYVDDPENPGQRIDIIEMLRRNPNDAPPVNIDGLLRRDFWTRQEALLILAGLAPRNVVHGGLPIGTIGAGIVYLDGTTSAQLDAEGLQHPRAQAWLPEFTTLAGYAAGQDMGESKAPTEWLAWAKSKGFAPYWLDAEPQPAPAEQAATIEEKGMRKVYEWTPERIEEMRQYRDKLKGQPLCRDFTTRTAEKYGITASWVRQLLAKPKTVWDAPKIKKPSQTH